MYSLQDLEDIIKSSKIDERYKKVRDGIPIERRKELINQWYQWLVIAGQIPQPNECLDYVFSLRSLNTAELVYFGSFCSGVFLSLTMGEPIPKEVQDQALERMMKWIDEGLD